MHRSNIKKDTDLSREPKLKISNITAQSSRMRNWNRDRSQEVMTTYSIQLKTAKLLKTKYTYKRSRKEIF